MVLLAAGLVLATLVKLAAATPTRRDAMVIHERRAQPAKGFVNAGPADSSTQLQFRVALVPNNIAGLESELYAVSDPSSSRYGQHLTPDQVAEYVKPDAASLAAVTSWLQANNIASKSISAAGDVLQIQIPVSQANTLFDTQFSTYTHSAINGTSIRTLQYSLPSDVAPHVAYVHPTTSFVTHWPSPEVKPMPTQNGKRYIDPSCADISVPTCAIAEYGIPTTPATQANNVLAVSGFGNEFVNDQDIKTFLTQYRPQQANQTFGTLFFDGGSNTQLSNEGAIETTLEIEYTLGVVTGAPVTYISVGFLQNDGIGGYLDEINGLIAADSRPTVMTTSDGWDEDQLSLAVSQGLCNAYMQLGAMGVSILWESGNGGVGAGEGEFCTEFVPASPSTCPWVTSVGGSQQILENFTPDTFSEIAADFSTGGFSNYFPVPAYQQEVVSKYIASLNGTYAGLYNTTGRGFPDVAAESVNYIYYVDDGDTGLVSGTDFATPVFASVIAMLNDELLTAGKSPMGFLNPWLYSPAGSAALNDITVGSNPGCNTNGFSAGVSWDPVTGLGSPNYAAMKAALGL
ncbi:ATP-binding cassette transporter [Mycena chlorophos]|uniref:ATP-binding cassette transporter n=1 Tax=Mycena chlorophos TaxID=658473 RepID=A0A8H6WP02_MYCCL|nr:ATP-binding cassette transporter [Mycena chlorophos]